MPRFNPYEHALEKVSRAVVERTTTPETEAAMIEEARRFARKHRLDFDGTLAGVLRLADHADRQIRDHMARVEQQEVVDKAREFYEHRKKLFEKG